MSDDLRYIQAWPHYNGSSAVVHAAIDRPGERRRIALGCMGIFTETACGLKGDPADGGPFMRLYRSDDDAPTTGADGWVTDWDYRGRDWAQPLTTESAHRCVRCARAVRRGES